jgi:hypothetical protein
MCDVATAAALTLNREDLQQLGEEDLPSPTGLVILPHPLLVRAVRRSRRRPRLRLAHSGPDLAKLGWALPRKAGRARRPYVPVSRRARTSAARQLHRLRRPRQSRRNAASPAGVTGSCLG